MEKYLMTMLTLLTLLVLVAGCSFFGLDEDSSSRSLQTGETVTLEEGQSVELTTTPATLRFVEKMADSRCPIGVDCIWEGEATLMLELTPTGGQPASLELKGFVGPEGDGEVTAATDGLQITLQRLDPYPVDGEDQSDLPIVATFLVQQR